MGGPSRRSRGWCLVILLAVASQIHFTQWRLQTRQPAVGFVGDGPRPGGARPAPWSGARDLQALRMATLSSAAKSSNQIEVLYDGLCKVCLTNKALLESQDNTEPKALRFVNIADDDYDSDEHQGIEFDEAMNEIHIILPDGEVKRGTEAVFTAYEAVGLDWAVGILSSPFLRGLTEGLYRFVSDNREIISSIFPGGDSLRESLRSARFLQKGVAEGEGCSEKEENEDEDEDDDDDCTISEDKLRDDMGDFM